MNEREQNLIELAKKYAEPTEFVRVLEEKFKDATTNEKANFLLESGNVLFDFSYYNLTLNLLNQALKYFQEVGDKDGERDCYTILGNTYVELGDFKKAIAYYEKSLEIAKQIRNREGESGEYTNLGIAYRSLGEYRKAIEYHEKSLEIAKDIKNVPAKASAEARCYTNLGNTYDSLGDFKRAIEYLEKSLEIARQLKDIRGVAGCYTSLGGAYRNLGNFRTALNYYEMALGIIKSIQYRAAEPTCIMGMANTYYSVGEFGRAIEYYEKALAITKEIGNRDAESMCRGNLGNAYYSLGEFKKAIECYEQALEIEKEIGNRVTELCSRGNLGNAYCSLGEFKKAIEYHEQALEIAKEIGNKEEESTCYIGLGVVYYNMGEFSRAIQYFESSLRIVEKTGNIDAERIVSLNLGMAHYDHDPELAYNYLKKSIDISELIGKSLVEVEQEIGFYALATNVYQSMIRLCLKLNREEDAFHYTERSKSKTFLDMLAATDIKPSNRLVEQKSLLEVEKACLARLREIQMHHLRKTGISLELGEVDEINKRLNKIHDEMEKIDPEYVFMRGGKPPLLDRIKDTITSKKKNAILVEYFVTKDKVIIFVVSKDGLIVERVSLPVEEVLKYIEAYRREVLVLQGMAGDTWLGLSKYLIEPISDYLSKSDLIYLIPFGTLHYLPMHALELDGEPLIEKHPVCYSPAASIIQFCKNKGTGKLEKCASFGTVFEDEARKVAKLFDSTPYLGETVNKERVIECANKDIIHLSCHGYFNYLDPLSSGVLLNNKEVLTAREIFDMRINAELVTLSACQTGLNKRMPGDELIGLTRAFLYAGAPSVVVSLWSVDAQSTQELMLEFYRLLISGKDKATALQEAQKEIMKREEYSDPYYWAPFVLVGDWE
ncbi:MAG: tetratricopeptide repeat protein [Candidatus Bathyarchaeia archaeon]|jgi:CHAT domain-containing protein/tetratricopeptide (TPR) repeat protein